MSETHFQTKLANNIAEKAIQNKFRMTRRDANTAIRLKRPKEWIQKMQVEEDTHL